MHKLIRALSEPTLKTLINDVADNLQACNESIDTIHSQQQCTEYRQLLTELLYAYLERFNITNDMLAIATEILTSKDVDRLKDKHHYNYHKLLLILKHAAK